MTAKHISEQARSYYDEHIGKHGFSAQGVGWKNEKAQRDRFLELKKLIDQPVFTINDLGCGTGAFYDFLLSEGCHSFDYRGYDVLDKMITHASENYRDTPSVSFKKIGSAEEMETADYSVASGIFSLKYDHSEEDWITHVTSTLQQMNEKSSRGFAFNMLTKYSDPDRINPDLYYADPLFIFDYCMKHFSRKVALLHDYEQFDFTILLKK